MNSAQIIEFLRPICCPLPGKKNTWIKDPSNYWVPSYWPLAGGGVLHTSSVIPCRHNVMCRGVAGCGCHSGWPTGIWSSHGLPHWALTPEGFSSWVLSAAAISCSSACSTRTINCHLVGPISTLNKDWRTQKQLIKTEVFQGWKENLQPALVLDSLLSTSPYMLRINFGLWTNDKVQRWGFWPWSMLPWTTLPRLASKYNA